MQLSLPFLLKKTSTEGISPVVPGLTSAQLDLNLQPQPFFPENEFLSIITQYDPNSVKDNELISAIKENNPKIFITRAISNSQIAVNSEKIQA